MTDFWSLQCPARGATLTHAHWDKCTPEGHPGGPTGHEYAQCCECGQSKRSISLSPDEAEAALQARLKLLGFNSELVLESSHDDDTLIEPKYITGDGPAGPKDGRLAYGRGKDLTPEDIQRLEFFVYHMRPNRD